MFEVFEVRSVEKIDGKLYREASIQFECKAKPKAAEYWGFYYVEDGEPVSYLLIITKPKEGEYDAKRHHAKY